MVAKSFNDLQIDIDDLRWKKIFHLIYILMFVLIFSGIAKSATLATDNFSNNNKDGWQNGYTYYGDGWLYIDKDVKAYKIYHFGSAYANKPILIKIRFWLSSGWDKRDGYYARADIFRAFNGNTEIATYSGLSGDTTYTTTISSQTDSNGDFTLKIQPDSDRSNEYTALDYVQISTDSTNNAELSITKSVDNSSPQVGDIVTFTIVGKNNGPSSSQIEIRDTLPAGLEFDTSYSSDGVSDNRYSFTCSTSGRTATCNGSRNFITGDSVTVTIKARVVSSATISNTATISSYNGKNDPDTTNNSSTAVLSSSPTATDLSIDSLNSSSNPVGIGEDINYTAHISNNGNITAGIKLDATISSGNFKSGPLGWTCSGIGTKTMQCSRDSSMASGTSEDANFVFIAPSSSQDVTLRANITSSSSDTNSTNNENSTTTTVLEIVNNADDICHEDVKSSGLMCIDMGVCKGGMGCKNTYPLRNKGDSNLTNVKVYYNESGLGGSFGSNCGVTPSGTCGSSSNIDFGPFGFFGKATKYNLDNDIAPNQNNSSVWASNFMSASCLNGNKLYATYIKDGVLHRGKVKPCNIDINCANPKDFNIVYRYNGHSKMIMSGNVNLCKRYGNSGHSCSPYGANRNQSNNVVYMINDDYDDVVGERDNGSTTINSSAAKIDIPEGKKVLWAGLFWQGYFAGNYSESEKLQGKYVKFKHEGDLYQQITGDMHWVYTSPTRMYYQGFKDVTNYVNAHGGGYYWVGDIISTEGTPAGGSYGGWSMAVVYQDKNEPFRNTTIFYGYKGLASQQAVDLAIQQANANGCDAENIGVSTKTTSNISGFLTPKVGDVNASLIVFAGEGDIWSGDEHGSITDKNGVEHRLSNSINPDGNIMNSTITKDGVYIRTGKPYFSDNILGIDIDTYDMNNALSNSQTSTKITLQTDGDYYFPGLYGLESNIREASVCFDYTYGQNGFYVSAPSITTPIIKGTFNKDNPLDVKLFLENNDSSSDVQVKDVKVNIDPIDTTQGKYKTQSTYVRLPNNSRAEHIDDSLLDTNDSYLKNIQIGDLSSDTSTYVYYSLDLNKSNVDMPINASINYSLAVTIDGELVIINNLNTALNDIKPCSQTSQYQPKYGIFNVVHPKFHKSGDYYYYNLPTQVVNRVGNFKIQTMDKDDINKPIDLNLSIAAVEMISSSGFHYTMATCRDPRATLLSQDRIWVITNTDGTLSDLINKDELSQKGFFSKASSNTAFRISYNMDQNGSLMDLQKLSSGRYKITNFPNYAQGKQCQKYFVPPYGNSKQITSWCGNNGEGSGGNGMTQKELATCMECIYGLNTKILCSRDNFAIRPESYSIKIDDMNQSNQNQKLFIANNMNGTPSIKLSAGYKYLIDINATDHNNSSPTEQYYTNKVDAKLTWNAPNSYKCADESNITIPITFYNGYANIQNQINQTGVYTLSLIDKDWTKIDYNSSYMAHHISGLFKSGADCVEDSDVVVNESNWNSLNGCIIKSKHSNTENTQEYNDMNISYHPYKFDLSSLTLKSRPNIIGRSWVYMNNLEKNKSVAITLEGNITALGANNIALSNYTSECMAKDLNLYVNAQTTPNPIVDKNGTVVPVQQTINEYESTDSTRSYSAVLPIDNNLTLSKYNFRTDESNGTAKIEWLFNLAKPYDFPVNIAEINFTKAGVYSDDDNSSADFTNNHQAKGEKVLNGDKYLYFSKVAPMVGTDGHVEYKKDYPTRLRVDVYCDDKNNFGLDCSTLPDFVQPKEEDEISRTGSWYRISTHTDSDGKVLQLTVDDSNGASTNGGTVTPSSSISLDKNGSSDVVTIHYPRSPRPENVRIWITPQEWLKYNPSIHDINDIHYGIPKFSILFENGGLEWRGKGKTGNVIQVTPTPVKNERLNW